jgi:hypothetical protein
MAFRESSDGFFWNQGFERRSVEPACITTEPALENVLDHQIACWRWHELCSDARAA